MRRPLFRPPVVLVVVALSTAAAGLALTGAGPASAAPADVVISEVYGGGGNTGAPINRDFVELFNRSASPVSLTGWSVQYASATGTGAFTVAAPLNGSLAPGQHYLVGLASGANGAPLPTPDASGATAMGATAGKVAIVATTTGLGCNGGSTPCSPAQAAAIVDLVGYGNASFFEGSGPAPAPANPTGISRGDGGCADTDDNAADLAVAPPTPRTTADTASPCGGPPPPPPPPPSSCGDAATPVSAVQGAGTTSPLAGTTVTVEGVVVGDFEGSTGLRGFALQEADAGTDADPATSEGIFVFDSANRDLVAEGDRVRVTGTVSEFGDPGVTLTELTLGTVAVCASGVPLPTAAAPTLPLATPDALERYEGMRVALPQTLTVSETFTLARFGELLLSSAGRLWQPTHVAEPGPGADAVAAANALDQLVLDDGLGVQNPAAVRWPAPGGLSAASTVRVGDTVAAVTGVMDQRFGAYRVQPTADPVFGAANPRPPAPPAVGGRIRVASLNLLNYFNGDGAGGGFPTPRGAESAAEFARQRAKTIAAVRGLDADVIAVMELENDDTAGGYGAIEDLVDGLNAATAAGTYAFVDTGVLGTDQIRVGLLHRPAAVTPVGPWATLTTGTFTDRSRPPLAQTFRDGAGGEVTVVANHFKSKGSCPSSGPDADQGDGQGCWNATRVLSSQELAAWLATAPTGTADPDVLVLGDLNSYAREDPVDALRAAGYDDLLASHVGASAWSYVFDGRSGYLDHALANTTLAGQVTGVGEWHVNADEPVALDYNVNFKSADQQASFYDPGPYRSSDHDPVVVGLNLAAPPAAFPFSGFFGPVDNLPAVNRVRAGSLVPVIWKLGGNPGRDVLTPGSPASRPVACGTGAPLGAPVPADAPQAVAPVNVPGIGLYVYAWKTDRSWSGCRRFDLTLTDGTVHQALFRFA